MSRVRLWNDRQQSQFEKNEKTIIHAICRAPDTGLNLGATVGPRGAKSAENSRYSRFKLCNAFGTVGRTSEWWY